jgi:hypothetical protein
MSIFKTTVLLAAVVMLLPAEEKSQTQLASTASRTAERAATYCERNPSTCATGRDVWALFVRKAEYGLELGAGLLREHLLRGAADEAPQQPAAMPTPASAPVPTPHKAVEVVPVKPATVASARLQPSPLELPPPPSRRTNFSMEPSAPAR